MLNNHSLTLLGTPVYESSLAISRTVIWEVIQHPRPKRRRRWSVRSRVETAPAAFQTRMGLYIHPDLLTKIRKMLRQVEFSKMPA